jgi:adenylosuccinate synthase
VDVLKVVVISGQVAAGKSTLAHGLAERYGGRRVSTKELLQHEAERRGDELPAERGALQDYGTKLDGETGGRWVADAVSALISGAGIAGQEATDLGSDLGSDEPSGLWVIDAVRIPAQIDTLRDALGIDIVHVHLHSTQEVLARRYADRGEASGIKELASYDEVTKDPTEQGVNALIADADVAIDTARSNVKDVLIRAAAALGLLPDADSRLVDVLIGAQYGSEGKGNIAFFLAREYDLLVRVGGPNAGHKVPTPTVYTHRQLPSGTRANERAKLLIGPGATIDPALLLTEIADCGVDADRLWIDPQAMIIEPGDLEAEQALVKTIASTGKGGGHAASRRILGRSGELPIPVRLARDVQELAAYIRPARDVLDEAYRRGHRILLEGTQGTALSMFHGDYPHVTSRDTTTSGTLAEAGIGPRRLRRVILVARTYPIRVKDPDTDGGTSGPMSQEMTFDQLSERSGVGLEEITITETSSVSQRLRRIAEFDWDLLRRSVELNGATDIALTFADYLNVDNQKAQRYDQLTDDTIRFIEEVEQVSGISVSLISTRFDIRAVIDRRRW